MSTRTPTPSLPLRGGGDIAPLQITQRSIFRVTERAPQPGKYTE
jgi:hypothetical protein